MGKIVFRVLELLSGHKGIKKSKVFEKEKVLINDSINNDNENDGNVSNNLLINKSNKPKNEGLLDENM